MVSLKKYKIESRISTGDSTSISFSVMNDIEHNTWKSEDKQQICTGMSRRGELLG
jgi:hypothetical protein